MPTPYDARHFRTGTCDRIPRVRNFTPEEAAQAVAAAVGPGTRGELRFFRCDGQSTRPRSVTADSLRTDPKFAKWVAKRLDTPWNAFGHLFPTFVTADGRHIPLYVVPPSASPAPTAPSATSGGVDLSKLTPEQIEALGKLTPEQLAVVSGQRTPKLSPSSAPPSLSSPPAVPWSPPPNPKPKSRGRQWLFLVIVIVVLVLLYGAWYLSEHAFAGGP